MAKSTAEKILSVKNHLILRTQIEFLPGGRFLTNREVADEYSISYVTAHRILDDLCMKGLLVRRSTNGTFLPGRIMAYQKAHLIFNPKANQPGRFGSALLRELCKRLDAMGIAWKLSWASGRIVTDKEDYHILWERLRDSKARELSATGRRGLLLNQPPPPSTLQSFDSVRIDYFAAGVRAGEFLRAKKGCRKTTCIGFPTGKSKASESFVRGFRSEWPNARFVNFRAWEKPAKFETLAHVAEHKDMGICCAAVTSSVQLMQYYQQQGLDTSMLVASAEPPRPSSVTMPFITVPLYEIVGAATRIIRNRFAGDSSCPTHITLEPRLYP